MTKIDFLEDLQTIYDALQRQQSELNDYFALLKDGHEEADELVKEFLRLLGLKRDEETTMAALTRIVQLREDPLEQIMRKEGFSETEIRTKKELAYGFVSMMHITRHERLIGWIEERKLLTPFYRALIFGVHYVGVRLSEWQSHWTAHIIHSVNLELNELFDGDDARIFEILHSNSLLDRNERGEIADRCYSVLVKDHDKANVSSVSNQPDALGTSYRSVSYAEAFPKQTADVVEALDRLVNLLEPLEDEVYGQKREWISYFNALKLAFSHTVVDELVGKWAEVDRRWMAITTPLQVGHPLEYYEDHYRKAVALEWDLRIVDPRLQERSHTRESIKLFAYESAKKLAGEKLIAKNLGQIDDTQLYIGRPMLYYAAEFNGLFSAQVVPNDETVSEEHGKKIFAYPDFVLESKRSKPIMELSVETMGREFVLSQRMLAERNPDLWHRIYDISTIGHEFGHMLWMDSDTECSMNGSGQFKNIEEFKATAGGLMAFFRHEDAALSKHITDELVSRAIGLMAWREAEEVLPYYCEGLIHLDILFSTATVRFDEKITIDYDRYPTMKKEYIEVYEELARHYLNKTDAAEFLERFAVKENGVYLPVREEVRSFVEHYYDRYKEMGQKIYNGDIAIPKWDIPDTATISKRD